MGVSAENKCEQVISCRIREELAKVKTVGIVLYGVSNLYSGPNSLDIS